MAYELINLREQVQTELQAERDKAVAAVRGESPAKQNAQPVAPVAGSVAAPQAVAQQLPMPLNMFPAQAVPQQLPMPLDPQQVFAFPQMVRQQFMQTQQLLRMPVQR